MTEGSWPKVDGDIYYASEADTSTYSSIKTSINNLYFIGIMDVRLFVDTGNGISYYNDDFNNITWDSFIDDSKYDSVNSSNVFLNVTNHTVTLEYDLDSVTESCDFTGGSLDADFSAHTVSPGTSTFDATNDEQDCNASRPQTAGTSAGGIDYDTAVTTGIFETAFRNIGFTIAEFTSSTYIECMLYKDGGNSLYLRRTGSNNFFILDSFGGSYNTGSTSAPSICWLRMTIRADGSAKTEYRLSDSGSFTTLSEVDSGASTSSATIRSRIYMYQPEPGGQMDFSASIYAFNIYEDYCSSGYFVSDTITTSDTIYSGVFATTDTTPANTSISYAASADNGSNYETHSSSNLYHKFTNTGNQLKIKVTLSTTDISVTPTLSFYGYAYNQY